MKTKKEYPKFYSMDCLVNYYDRTSQGFFFSKDTMNFFKSRLTSNLKKLDDKTYLFVTTEKRGFTDLKRQANLRLCEIKKDKTKFGGFTLSITSLGTYNTISQAVSAMNKGLKP